MSSRRSYLAATGTAAIGAAAALTGTAAFFRKLKVVGTYSDLDIGSVDFVGEPKSLR
jgi:hypothetical protein